MSRPASPGWGWGFVTGLVELSRDNSQGEGLEQLLLPQLETWENSFQSPAPPSDSQLLGLRPGNLHL